MGRARAPKVTPYQKADGTTSYRVRLRVGGRQTTETFDSPQAANVFALRVADPNIGPERAVSLRDREDEQSSDYVPTLAEMLESHLRGLSGVDPRTPADYRSVAGRTWLKQLGSLRVDELTRRDVADWVNAAAGTMAPKSIRNAHSILSATMKSAMHDGYVTANPAAGTRLPRAGEEAVEEIRFLTTGQFDTLYPEIPLAHQPMVVWMFGMGTRFSETTAHQPEDIDLSAGQHLPDGTFDVAPTARVVRAWKTDNRIGPPKSRAGRRTLVMPEEVVEAVAPLMAARQHGELLFQSTMGKRVRHSSFYNRVWVPATVRASVCVKHRHDMCRCITSKPWECTVHTKDPRTGDRVWPTPCGCGDRLPFRPRIHDARHTHASWLIAQGTRLEVVQERLGHEDYLTTRRVYGHLMPDMKRAAGTAASLAFASTRSLSPGATPMLGPGSQPPA